MCGIGGWYTPGARIDRAAMPRMLAQMVHRGPDDEGAYFDEHVALGMRRLSIIDVAGGHQPIANENERVWTVLNGEIYNFRELRRELEARGHRFRTRTDTEVIVHGYEEWGDAVLERLNGMFGLAVWDRDQDRVLLARDPYGVKPLYWHARAGGGVAWASEVKALLAALELTSEVDLDALSTFLALRYVPSPRTLFRGIQRLRPGHMMVCDRNGEHITQYFNPPIVLFERSTDDELVERLQHALEHSVQRQMISDVPIGALLSGGADSAAVVGLMRTFTSKRVATFTVGFKDAGNVDELAAARDTANYFGTEHHELVLDSVDYRSLLQRAIWHLEEPIATSSALAMLLVCELAQKSVTVVLTGQGADEPHLGYARYVGEAYGHLYRSVPELVRDTIGPLVEYLPRNERLKRAVRSLPIEDPVARFAEIHALFDDRARKELLRSTVIAPAPGVDETFEYWRKGIEHLPTPIQMAHIDARMSLADDLMLYGDKMSMAASVEARVPFLDLEYMQVAESLPLHARVRGLTRKALHKRAIAKWVPERVLRRPKLGFDTPIDSWFRGELRHFVRETLLARNSACSTYFEPAVLARLLENHASGRADRRRQIFSLLTFELWHRAFIAKVVP